MLRVAAQLFASGFNSRLQNFAFNPDNMSVACSLLFILLHCLSGTLAGGAHKKEVQSDPDSCQESTEVTVVEILFLVVGIISVQASCFMLVTWMMVLKRKNVEPPPLPRLGQATNVKVAEQRAMTSVLSPSSSIGTQPLLVPKVHEKSDNFEQTVQKKVSRVLSSVKTHLHHAVAMLALSDLLMAAPIVVFFSKVLTYVTPTISCWKLMSPLQRVSYDEEL